MKIDSSAIARWRTARRITLGAIVIAGTMSTAAAVSQRMAHHPCSGAQVPEHNYYTYSGIGVELTQDGSNFVVAHVFPGSPADGVLYPGAVLLSVNGETRYSMQQWTAEIRGEQGTSVELEVMYPCSKTQTVEIERDLVRIRY